MPQAPENLYYNGLASLWQCSDEKQAYIAKFSDSVDRYGATSLLDIGAGDGQIALPLSETVDDYLAIEPNPEYAARLRQAGKRVIEEPFPTDVDGTYDIVLMSHVISHTVRGHTTMVPPAWELVKDNGHLLVAIHRGVEQDDWTELLDRVGLGYSDHFDENLRDCVNDLRARGETEIDYISSTLAAGRLGPMIESMGFLASNGDEARHAAFMDKAADVARILDETYRTPEGYAFPFLHKLVSVQKPSLV